MPIGSVGSTAVQSSVNWSPSVEAGASVDKREDFKCPGLPLDIRSDPTASSIALLRIPSQSGLGKEELKVLAGGLVANVSALAGLAAGVTALSREAQANAGALAPVGYSFKQDEQVAAFFLLIQALSQAASAKRELKGKMDTNEWKAEMSQVKSIRDSAASTLGHRIGASVSSVVVTVAGARQSHKGLVQQRQSLRQNSSMVSSQQREAGARRNVLDGARSDQAALQKLAPKLPNASVRAEGAQSRAQADRDLGDIRTVGEAPHAQKAAQVSLDHEVLMSKGAGAQVRGGAVMQMAPVVSGVVTGSGEMLASLESAGQKVHGAVANSSNKASNNERDSYGAIEAFANNMFNLIMNIIQAEMGLMASVAGNTGLKG